MGYADSEFWRAIQKKAAGNRWSRFPQWPSAPCLAIRACGRGYRSTRREQIAVAAPEIEFKICAAGDAEAPALRRLIWMGSRTQDGKRGCFTLARARIGLEHARFGGSEIKIAVLGRGDAARRSGEQIVGGTRSLEREPKAKYTLSNLWNWS
jgi:hypothetical protein